MGQTIAEIQPLHPFLACLVNPFAHQSVLLSEAMQYLAPKPEKRYLDATVGGAGHAAAILEASAPTGWLFGCDRDGAAIDAAAQRLAPFAGRFELRHVAFDQVDQWIEPESCDGVLADLGLSSPMVDHPERGFSFLHDGPLDMRMDRHQTLTAAAVIRDAPLGELIRIFGRLGGEPRARTIARAIDSERRRNPLDTTGQLARLIERLQPRRGNRTHPATRVFLGLRLHVNDELAQLERGLPALWRCVAPGGRLAVITFHSLEDRQVKEFGNARARSYTCPGTLDIPELRQPRSPDLRWISRRPIRPSPEEIAANPRSRSAQLRVMEKCHAS